MLIRDNVSTEVVEVPQINQYQLQGVNTPEQLKELERVSEDGSMFFEKL